MYKREITKTEPDRSASFITRDASPLQKYKREVDTTNYATDRQSMVNKDQSVSPLRQRDDNNFSKANQTAKDQNMPE
jgi:hypothetical protein